MQVDSIHSGSISFGRFENEPLSWERRSSFSHNRYLEEVEKCSKPGSVIQKKAYFEAHFKKKGILGIIPSTAHDGLSYRATGENDGCEGIGKQEDFESNNDQYVPFDEMSQKEFELDEGDHYVEIGRRSQEDLVPIEENHYIQFHEIPDSSNYHGECGMNECEKEESITEYPMLSFSSLQMESVINNSNHLEDASKKNITLDEAQSKNETSDILLANDEAVIEVEKHDDVTVSTDESSISMSITVNEPAQGVEETIMHDLAKPSPEVCMSMCEVPFFCPRKDPTYRMAYSESTINAINQHTFDNMCICASILYLYEPKLGFPVQLHCLYFSIILLSCYARGVT